MKLADKIRIIRKARGFSQEGLGYKLSRVNKDGISRQTVSDWENGKCEPKLENIRDLAAVLEVSFDALLDESIDLEDKRTLNAVLKNLSDDVKQEVNSKFRYSVNVSDISKLAIIWPIVLILGATLIILPIFLDLKSKTAIILMYSIGAAVSVVGIQGTIISLIKFIKNKGRYIGELNNTHLILHTSKEAENTLYIPIEKIIKIEVVKGASKRKGDIEISIEGKARHLFVHGLVRPFELVNFFENVHSSVVGPDDVQIV